MALLSYCSHNYSNIFWFGQDHVLDFHSKTRPNKFKLHSYTSWLYARAAILIKTIRRSFKTLQERSLAILSINDSSSSKWHSEGFLTIFLLFSYYFGNFNYLHFLLFPEMGKSILKIWRIPCKEILFLLLY